MSATHAPPPGAARSKRALFSLGAVALALPIALTPVAASAATFAPADGLEAIETSTYQDGYLREFVDQVDPSNIWAHDEHLSVEIGPRVAGSPGEDAAVEYVEGLFQSYGLETERETFQARSQNYANVVPSRYQEGYASWQFRPATNALFTGPGAPVSGDLVDVGAGDDLADVDVDGKIVLANWIQSAGNRNALLTALHDAGATAIVLAQTSGSEALPSPGAVPASLNDTVVVAAATNQGDRMRALLSEGPLSLSITTEQSRDTSTNVIGVLPAANGDADAPIVYIGAHIDSVVGSPGASDNGSGTSIMLELARIIGQYSYDVEIRFGAWGAEEIGIVGSRFHVDSLKQDEIDRTIGAWNMDMAGTAYEGNPGQPFGFWALTVDGSQIEDNSVLSYGATVMEELGYETLNTGQVGRSDHQYFHDAGIDAAVFSWMFWAGGTNIILEPAYHMTTDTLEFVSAERMGYAAEVLGGSAFLAALNTVTVNVIDENGEPAADVPVAMSCEADEGWREVGVTDETGAVSTAAPHATCDFVALAENGAEGSDLLRPISGDTEIDLQLQVDTQAPTVTISGAPPAGATGWHQTAPVTVTIAAADDFYGEPAIEYSLDGGATWTTYAAPFELSDEGAHDVLARATDGFGNVGEAAETFAIDTVAPDLSVVADPSKRGRVLVNATDATSGVDRVEYRTLPDGEWLEFTGEARRSGGPLVGDLTLGSDAVRVEFRAVDVAGNASGLETLAFAQGPASVDTLSQTGSESSLPFILGGGALLLLASGGALLLHRRFRSVGQMSDL